MWLYADIKTLADIPRLYARTRPDKVALVDGSGEVSFAALDDQLKLFEPRMKSAATPKEAIVQLVHSYMQWVGEKPELARFGNLTAP